jgi:hypothetical protein
VLANSAPNAQQSRTIILPFRTIACNNFGETPLPDTTGADYAAITTEIIRNRDSLGIKNGRPTAVLVYMPQDNDLSWVGTRFHDLIEKGILHCLF